ncbi:MAG: GerAB/ArcD/ProY family transporter [Clostridium sp.]|uniref:GerAB/ArcD/ProY family transporter n=1 Tax=Clostridium sp. TaxID=1506 RepID=UPI003F40DF69
MNKKLQITTNQFISLIVGYTLVLLEIRYPAVLANKCNQDAWLIPFFSSIYPILFFTFYYLVYKKYPNKNIFQVNIIILGKYLGFIFNSIFIFYIFLYSAISFASIALVLNTTIIWYYTISQMVLFVLIMGFATTFFSIESILKVSQVYFYLIIIAYLIMTLNFKDGSILNIMPILSDTTPQLLRNSTYNGLFMFAGFEIFLIYIPYMKNKKDYKKVCISTIIILTLLMSGIIFSCTFYFGNEALGLFYFPVLNMTSSINMPLINNFTFVFIVLLSFNSLKNSSLCFFNFIYSLPEKRRNKYKYFLILLLPVPLFLISKPLTDMVYLDAFIGKIFIPLMIILLLNIFILFISTLRRNLNEKKNSI